MKTPILQGAIIALFALPACAQQSPGAPATDQTAPSSGAISPTSNNAEAARNALSKKEGDADQATLLKETLTAVNKQYSLIKEGSLQTTYDLNYTYIGQEKINADLSSGTLTLFNIENDSAHTITNTVSFDYGVEDNLTGSMSLPLVSKYSQNADYDGLSHSIGDIGLGARWQPVEVKRGEPSTTLTGNLRLPTGRSPFKVDANKGLATGAGVTTLSIGANINHIVDPVALFGSINLSGSLPAKHLSQNRNGKILNKVAPGASFGFGAGFAYAMSYNISTSISYQQSISAGSKLTFDDGSTVKTNMQTASILNFGLGYRVSPKTTINMTVGIGLTADSPNVSLDLSLPLAF